MSHPLRVASFVLSTLAAVGCGGAPKPQSRTTVVMEELRITPGGAYDAESLFEEAFDLRKRGDCPGAVARYDRVVAEFPKSAFASAALYNGGLCLMETGAADKALPRFERLTRDYPQSNDVRDARFQLAVIYTTVGRHAEGLAIADSVLAEPDPSLEDRMDAMSLRAHALLGLSRIEEAERQARIAVAFYDEHSDADGLVMPPAAARSHYVLADCLRIRSEAIAIPAGTAEQQHAVLEKRAVLLLEAQTEYFNAIRQSDARWSSAAGFRVGALYDGMWDAITKAPVPPPKRKYNAEAMAAYEDEYRKEMGRQIRPLVRHAIRYWELTLMMIERTHVRTEWTVKVEEALAAARARLEGDGATHGGEPETLPSPGPTAPGPLTPTEAPANPTPKPASP